MFRNLMRNTVYILVCTIVSFCLVIAQLHADTIKLRSGEEVKGKIVREDEESLLLELPDGKFRAFSKAEIVAIYRDSDSQPEKEKPPRAEKKSDIVLNLPMPDHKAHSQFATLISVMESIKPFSPGDFKNKLVEIGPAVVPSLLHYLNREPKENLIDATLEAMVKLEKDKAVGYLKYFLRETNNTKLHSAVVRVLQDVGSIEALGTLLKLLSSEQQDMRQSSANVIIAILRSQPRNHGLFDLLYSVARTADKNLKIRIINILGSSKSRLAAVILLKLLEYRENANVTTAVLIALGRLGFGDSDTCFSIRKYLKDDSPQVRKEAALALGRLQDLESVGALIPMLKDENSGVRKNAYWAIKKITGLRFPLNYQRWKAWWDDESKETRKKRDALLAQLRAGTQDEVIKAIDALAINRLGQKQIISALAEFLESGDPGIRKTVCAALGTLKAREAVPKLIIMLDDTEKSVIAAAHGALTAITGWKLQPDRKAWEEACAGGK